MLHLHRSERADALVAGLADVLGADAGDPFTPDVVAVPARGVERWLTQQLSHRLGAGPGGDGVCANVVFPWPSRLVADAIAAGSGVSPDADPWRAGRLLWSVLDVIDDSIGDAWLVPLGRHLGEGRGRRLVAARHLTALFESYAAHRPAMLRGWLDGGDTDGLGEPLPADLAWQAELWRRLRARVATASPAERLDAACAALRDDPSRSDLPARLSVFGPTRLTTDQVGVLAALAEHREVHLWLPHPSAPLWDRVAPLATGRPRRRADPTAGAAAHPLLSSLGRDAREMQLVLADSGAATTDTHHPLTEPPGTLLGRLQHDLRRDVAPPGAPLRGGGGGADDDVDDTRALLARDDRSLQVHACHGRARQVEVLREVLLGLLAADPTLESRDVLVMCPDIEAYAPLISATFGLTDADDPGSVTHPGHQLRVRLADRSLRQTNPLLATMARLLELADGRLTASQVLDLAALPPVRRRFRFDDDALERLREWVAASGTRWGLDAAHRAPFHLESLSQNTWEAGLDRILLGAAMAEDELRWLGLALPLDDVDSGDIDLAGRLAELVDRVAAALDSLRPDQSLADWLAALARALDSLADVTPADSWQLSQARRQLDEVAETAGDPSAVTLSLADVRAMLADRLQGRPTRAGFRTGNLTVCSMVPMRSVPHRVICLLGLDDGAFPRSTGVDGDDVLARDPCVGERDRRSEDRQLLLDAILAATDCLVVVHTGADERTNARRPAAVPVGEILDVVDATARTPDGGRASGQIVVRHPLQPFDARNFVAGALGSDGPFSFDGTALAGALAAVRPRHPAEPFLPGPVPALEDAVDRPVELDDLLYFLEHPVRGFLRRRLNILVAEEGDDLEEALAIDLDGLQKWSVGDRWLSWRLAGHDADRCRGAEWRRGALPPGAIGARALAEVEDLAEPLVAAVSAVRTGPASSHDVVVPLPGGGTLTGTVGDVYGQRLVRATYSTLGAKHRLRAWVKLLALCAAEPGQGWQAVTFGRCRAGVSRSTLSGVDADRAAAVLGQLVDVYRSGLVEPLPLPLDTSCAYACARREGDTEAGAREPARYKWGGRFGEDRDRFHTRVWGDGVALEQLMAEPARPSEQLPDGPHEDSRFGALACRLWFPLLAAEEVDRP